MAKRDIGDPFASVSDLDGISVPAGVFRVSGPAERTGSTNARRARGGFGSRLRSAPAKARIGWLTAVVLVTLMVVVVPTAIALIGSVRKAQLEAQAAALPSPAVVAIGPEAQAVGEQIRQIDVAYLMSNGIAEQESRDQLGALLGEAKNYVLANDAASARGRFDEAVAYFITIYSQRLAAQVDPTVETFWGLDWQTEERLYELRDLITANADGHDLATLVAAVIELPQQISLAKSQHSAATGEEYYEPATQPTAAAPASAAPATTAPAETAPPATQAPVETQAPAPANSGNGTVTVPGSANPPGGGFSNEPGSSSKP